ncbi:MAG TPA: UdgX family uracil-DNA binding protein [Nannocystaceae bacterium]|nr:UdgX family uracil-DNA binding protein [Nannocystaceae bacterium]
MSRTKPVTAAAYVPHTRSLRVLARAASECTACHLYERATQTVFGEGAVPATMMLVGEQPGDREDLEGRPFVGPAGRLLDRALAAAKIGRDKVYVTNAVKHFKWRPVGKRRLHERPDRNEIEICKPWLHEEIALVQPRCVVALGATAALGLLGKRVGVASSRGRAQLGIDEVPVVVTFHPSSLLRMTEREDQDARFAELVEDLRLATQVARGAVELAS